MHSLLLDARLFHLVFHKVHNYQQFYPHYTQVFKQEFDKFYTDRDCYQQLFHRLCTILFILYKSIKKKVVMLVFNTTT
jgi:hypothetical protein